jgi:coenzyme F420-reducing hydrogenase delta subunit
MKFTKSELWDMLNFSNEELKEFRKGTYERKMRLLEELDNRMTEDNHIEIEFVSAESQDERFQHMIEETPETVESLCDLDECGEDYDEDEYYNHIEDAM